MATQTIIYNKTKGFFSNGKPLIERVEVTSMEIALLCIDDWNTVRRSDMESYMNLPLEQFWVKASELSAEICDAWDELAMREQEDIRNSNNPYC